MKVAAYFRESPTDDPNEDKINVQKGKVRRYCERQGYTDVVEFTEPGYVSGTTRVKDRPVAPELIRRIENGEFDVLVTSDDQRFTRSHLIGEWAVWMDALLLGNCDTDNPQAGREDAKSFERRIMRMLKFAFSAKERDDIIARQQGGRDEARVQNRYASGGVPYGIRWIHMSGRHPNRGYWEAVEDQVTVLKRFFALVKKGVALEKIADDFNAENIPTKYGKQWAGTTLNQILKTDFYHTGVLKFKDGTEVDTGIRLFTKAEIETARKARSLHPSVRKKRTRANEAKYPPGYKLLQGHIFCECGRVMTPHSSGYQWRCKRKGCRSNGHRMKETNDQVWKTFEDQLTDPEALYEALKAENFISGINVKEARKRVKVAEGKLNLIAESKDRFSIMWAKHRITEKAYESEMSKLEKEESYWKSEKARAKNTTYDSDMMELAAKSAADYMANKIKVIKALKEVRASLTNANTLTKLEYYPKLIEVMSDLNMELENYRKPESVEDVKNMTFEIKRNILKDASLNGVKIVSYKDGSIFIHGVVTSQFSVQTIFG